MIKKLAIVLGFALVFGCSTESVRISGKAYFPLRVGNFQIYTVNETDILELTNCGDGGQTIKNYRLKTLVTDSTKNIDGGYTYYIHRYTRSNDTLPWVDLDAWAAHVTESQVVVNEGNTAYVKLPILLYENEKWNGNLYNDFGEEDYTLKNYEQPYTIYNSANIPGIKYASTVTIVQSDNQDYFVYQDKRIEVYAANVGLIYKQTIQLTYFQDDSCYGQQKVQSGILYEQILLNNGHE